MKTTSSCGTYCEYDTMTITRWRAVDGTRTSVVPYNERTKQSEIISLLGGAQGGEDTLVTVTMNYEVHDDNGNVEKDKITNTYEFNVVRAGPPTKAPEKAPTVLSLTSVGGAAGIEVEFKPILFNDRNRGDVIDGTVTSYVFVR